MNVRRATPADLEPLLEIYAYARAQMKLNGNPLQWKDNRPSRAVVAGDIERGNSYVIEADGAPCGVFALIFGEEPTYRSIEGKWKNDAPYGTIHRIAGNGRVKGIFRICLEYCERQISNLRIDTHRDNKIMRHLIEKSGFEQCGIVYVDDGTPRIAYQKVV